MGLHFHDTHQGHYMHHYKIRYQRIITTRNGKGNQQDMFEHLTMKINVYLTHKIIRTTPSLLAEKTSKI